MVIELKRGDNIIIITPDNIAYIVKTPYCETTPWGIVTSSERVVYITDEEKIKVDEALRLRDEQIDKLIKNTDSIINELDQLNNTSDQIKSNTGSIVTSSSNTASNTSQILTQTKSNGTILSQIKSVCDNIYSWVRSHYAYSN